MPSPRSSSRIQPATLSRKYRSCVTAMTVPLYCCRCASSHWMDSVSRWFVGSSSKRTSGCWRRRRHSATRRLSPPESVRIFASEGGHWRASIARSSFASISQPSRCSMSSVSSPWRSMRRFISSLSIGSMNFIEMSLYSARTSITSCTPSWTTSMTVLSGSISGSCARYPTV